MVGDTTGSSGTSMRIIGSFTYHAGRGRKKLGIIRKEEDGYDTWYAPRSSPRSLT